MAILKNEGEIRIMREGGKRLAYIIEELKKEVRPGITTKTLDEKARILISKMGGEPSFLNYCHPDDRFSKPFPSALCVSINEEVVHGLPSERILRQGDIVSLDLGFFYQGFHTDMAITVAVAKVLPETARLIRVTKKVLKLAIKKVRPGNTLGDIGNTIERYIRSQGFNVIKELCGHGIGRKIHEEPQILNYGKRHEGPKIEPGMVFCLEPMATTGKAKIKRGEDGFSFKTADNSLSCHFEHTVAVTLEGCQALTMIRD